MRHLPVRANHPVRQLRRANIAERVCASTYLSQLYQLYQLYYVSLVWYRPASTFLPSYKRIRCVNCLTPSRCLTAFCQLSHEVRIMADFLYHPPQVARIFIYCGGMGEELG